MGIMYGQMEHHTIMKTSIRNNQLVMESCFHFFNTNRGELKWNDYYCDGNVWATVRTSYICQKYYTPYFQTTNITTEDTKVHEIDCSKSGKNPTCMAINETTYGNIDMEMDVLRMNEDVVSGILQSVQNIALSSVVRGYNRKNNADISVTVSKARSYTNVTYENVTVEINPDSFQGESAVVTAVRDTTKFTSSEWILSEVITVVSSKTLTGFLGITFSIPKQVIRTIIIYSGW